MGQGNSAAFDPQGLPLPQAENVLVWLRANLELIIRSLTSKRSQGYKRADECGQDHSADGDQVQLHVGESIVSPYPSVDRVIDCEIHETGKPYGEDYERPLNVA